MTLRMFLALMVFVVNVWALWGVASLPARRQRIRWALLIVGLPVVGAILWARRSREEVRA